MTVRVRQQPCWRIAVLGCGAMGSVYAGLLASAGHEVTAISRNTAHAQAMARDGLRVQGASGDRSVRLHAAVATAPATPMDLVILAVKALDVEAAARQALPMLCASTVVLALQNGVGSAEAIAPVLGAERLAVGVASGFGAALKGPGHVFHNAMKAVRMGAYAGLDPARVAEVAALWKGAGFDAEAVADIQAMVWEKLICNVAYSAPCAVSGLTIGELMADPPLQAISRAAAVEAWEVARALGVRLSVTDPAEHARAFGAAMPLALPSALQDHIARRPSELPVINGAVVRLGARAGVPTPVNDTLMALAQARERAWS